jgi:hypothetical protein
MKGLTTAGREENLSGGEGSRTRRLAIALMDRRRLQNIVFQGHDFIQ